MKRNQRGVWRSGYTEPKAFKDALASLGQWALRRANEHHKETTTRSMLRRKVDDLLSKPFSRDAQ